MLPENQKPLPEVIITPMVPEDYDEVRALYPGAG